MVGKQSKGSAMRAASFTVAGEDGATLDVSVIPLPGNSGTVQANVNRWRGQVGLPALKSDEDPALGNRMDGPSGEFFLSYMEGTRGGEESAIGAAIMERPDMTWFFKITGDPALLKANREKFEAFVRSATFN